MIKKGWLYRFSYVDRSNFDKYIAAFYWVTQTVVV